MWCLVQESLNMLVEARRAWTYSPGTRRVRRAPTIAYDNPGTNSDGITTSDSFGGFNGAPDRFGRYAGAAKNILPIIIIAEY